MSNNCLVTKLKGVVDNDNLETLGLLKFRFQNYIDRPIWFRGGLKFDVPCICDGVTVQPMTYSDYGNVTKLLDGGKNTATMYSYNYKLDSFNAADMRVDASDLEKMFKKMKYLPLGVILYRYSINYPNTDTIHIDTECFSGRTMGNCSINSDPSWSNINYVLDGEPVDIGNIQATDIFVLLIGDKIAVNFDIVSPRKLAESSTFACYCHGNIANIPLGTYFDLRSTRGGLTGEVSNLVSNWRTFLQSGRRGLPATFWNGDNITWNGTPIRQYVISQGLNPASSLVLNWDANGFSVTAS